MVSNGYARFGDGFGRCFGFGVVCLKCGIGIMYHRKRLTKSKIQVIEMFYIFVSASA